MTKQRKIWFVLLVLLLCFIWGNSLMSAPVSTDISEWFRGVFNEIAGVFGGGGTQSAGRIRKAAHFAEFALLGVVAALLMFSGGKQDYRSGAQKDVLKHQRGDGQGHLLLTLMLGLSAACADELIQTCSPGRSAQVSDVLLDFSGYLTGVVFVRAVRYAAAQRRRKKRE